MASKKQKGETIDITYDHKRLVLTEIIFGLDNQLLMLKDPANRRAVALKLSVFRAIMQDMERLDRLDAA